MIEAILEPTLCVVLVFLGVVVSHLLPVHIMRKNLPFFYLGFFGIGAIFLYKLLFDYEYFVKIAALALYFAIGVVYIEMRFLLSRGISTRLLVDLLEKGGSTSATTLKRLYGHGMGLDGLLRKRIDSLVKLKLLLVRDDMIGPLSWRGKMLTRFFGGFRKFLGLKVVG